MRGKLFAVDPRQYGIVFNPVPEGLAPKIAILLAVARKVETGAGAPW